MSATPKTLSLYDQIWILGLGRVASIGRVCMANVEACKHAQTPRSRSERLQLWHASTPKPQDPDLNIYSDYTFTRRHRTGAYSRVPPGSI